MSFNISFESQCLKFMQTNIIQNLSEIIIFHMFFTSNRWANNGKLPGLNLCHTVFIQTFYVIYVCAAQSSHFIYSILFQYCFLHSPFFQQFVLPLLHQILYKTCNYYSCKDIANSQLYQSKSILRIFDSKQTICYN